MIEPPSELRVVRVHSGAPTGVSKVVEVDMKVGFVATVEELDVGVDLEVLADVGGGDATTAVRGR